jgi:uncharacterized membrane protein (DUF2068 family)
VSEPLPRDVWVTLIGVGKMLKAATLIGLGTTALLLVHHDVVEVVRHWAFSLGVAPGGRFVREAIAGAGALDDRRLREIGAALLVYAALFTLEGTGLLLRKRWGEWVTIAITGSFIPIELYETLLHPHVGRAAATVLNVAAVAYLVHRVRQRRARERGAAAARA